MYRTLAIGGLMLAAALPLSATAGVNQSQYQDAYRQAVTAHKQAGRVENQWTTTSDALASAKKAAQDGDYAKATALAQRARSLAQLAVKQAHEQDQNWQKAVVQ